MRRPLQGPGVSAQDVLTATDYVSPCFEIVDSRIRDWQISIEDTVADNASCGLVVIGSDHADPRDLDLAACEMTLEANGRVLAVGTGAEALGSPLNCVSWLANTLGEYGVALEAGETILSGSLVPLLPANPGDHLKLSISGIGTAFAHLA